MSDLIITGIFTLFGIIIVILFLLNKNKKFYNGIFCGIAILFTLIMFILHMGWVRDVQDQRELEMFIDEYPEVNVTASSEIDSIVNY